MTVLRCTAKLLKRLRQPAKPPEPAPSGNPLGEWYADIDHWRRQPFVVMLNAATGAALVLPGHAQGLRTLNERALLQFSFLCEHFGIRGAAVDAELRGFDEGFTFARTRDRSLLGSLNERKFGAWMQFEHNDLPHAIVAEREWTGLFKHTALGRDTRHNMEYHVPHELVQARLGTTAEVIDLAARRSKG